MSKSVAVKDLSSTMSGIVMMRETYWGGVEAPVTLEKSSDYSQASATSHDGLTVASFQYGGRGFFGHVEAKYYTEAKAMLYPISNQTYTLNGVGWDICSMLGKHSQVPSDVPVIVLVSEASEKSHGDSTISSLDKMTDLVLERVPKEHHKQVRVMWWKSKADVVTAFEYMSDVSAATNVAKATETPGKPLDETTSFAAKVGKFFNKFSKSSTAA